MWRRVAICAVCCLLWPAGIRAQVHLPEDRGAAGLWQALLKLRTTASAMHIVAHPDDEDGGTITSLARGRGVPTTLLEPIAGLLGERLGFDSSSSQLVFVGVMAGALLPVQRVWRPYVDRVFFSDGRSHTEEIEQLLEELPESARKGAQALTRTAYLKGIWSHHS